MIIPLTAKIAAGLLLFYWNAINLTRDIESHPHPSAALRKRRDALRGLLTLTRAVITILLTAAVFSL